MILFYSGTGTGLCVISQIKHKLGMSDSEVATYVLGELLIQRLCMQQNCMRIISAAYLLRGSYQNTASAFLQECTVLPSKTVMVCIGLQNVRELIVSLVFISL